MGPLDGLVQVKLYHTESVWFFLLGGVCYTVGKSPMTDLIRQHLIFEGSVQNVGFRYEMTRLANIYGVTGWVKNLDDGRVEAHVQGSSTAIQAVIDALYAIQHIHIMTLYRSSLTPISGEIHFMTHYY